LRNDRLYLADTLAAADSIQEFLRDVSPEQFAARDLLRSAVLQKLIVIGEGAANVTAATRDRSGDVPWRKIVAFRSLAVHRYFNVDWSIVWTTATTDVVELRTQAEALFNRLDSDTKGTMQ
jgi:uncharacterized protein with HEPN domain